MCTVALRMVQKLLCSNEGPTFMKEWHPITYLIENVWHIESIAHYGVEICLFLCFKFWEFYLAVKGQQMVFRCEFEWP